MKKFLTIVTAAAWCCLSLHAQEPTPNPSRGEGSLVTLSKEIANGEANQAPLPSGGVGGGFRGESVGWKRFLHQGLNVQLSASVMAGFGKHAPHGAGFAQNLQATYLTPINNKLTLMVGGYVNNLNWGGLDARNAGLYGELSYQFNDHWEAHVYGQKNLAGTASGFIPGLYGGYGMGYWPMSLGSPMDGGYMGGVDRLGAGVRYMPNPSMSIEVNVEQVWLPNQSPVPGMGNMHQQVSTFGQQHGMPTQK